jgi:hypothetical protein
MRKWDYLDLFVEQGGVTHANGLDIRSAIHNKLRDELVGTQGSKGGKVELRLALKTLGLQGWEVVSYVTSGSMLLKRPVE